MRVEPFIQATFDMKIMLTNVCIYDCAYCINRRSNDIRRAAFTPDELTELTIDEILHKYRSAQDKFLTESFGTIAAYGPNAAMMHYHATEEDHAKLEKKGFLLVDSGATYMDARHKYSSPCCHLFSPISFLHTILLFLLLESPAQKNL